MIYTDSRPGNITIDKIFKAGGGIKQKFNSAEERENQISSRLLRRKLVQNQGAVGDVIQKSCFNLGVATSNRLDSTFNKIKNVSSIYAGLMQFLAKYFTVLKTFHSARNKHFLTS